MNTLEPALIEPLVNQMAQGLIKALLEYNPLVRIDDEYVDSAYICKALKISESKFMQSIACQPTFCKPYRFGEGLGKGKCHRRWKLTDFRAWCKSQG